jgi:putative oxidoreductase
MDHITSDDWGKLVLRLCLGGLLLFHGVAKLKTGVDWLEDPLAAYGLPAFVKYGVYLGEVLAPLLIVLGLLTRLGALVVIVNMLFVFGLVHMGDLYTLGSSGGWKLELQGFFTLTALALLIMGAGRIGVSKPGTWLN